MPGAGSYRDRVRLLPRVLASANTFGEKPESWPDPGESGDRWSRIESPAGGEQPNAPRQSTRAMNLRFRNEVELAAVDRVSVNGEVYAVLGIWRERAEHGGWQTVCNISGTY